MHNSFSPKKTTALAASWILAIALLALVAGVLFAQDGGTQPPAVAPGGGDTITGTVDGPLPQQIDISASDSLSEYIKANIVPPTSALAADLGGSSKQVDQAQAVAGEGLAYTIVISNSGSNAANSVMMTDTLPAGLAYAAGSLTVPPPVNGIVTGYGESGGVITWTGSLGPDGYATVAFNAILSGSLSAGATITNTAAITGAGTLLTRSAATLIVTETNTSTVHLPIIFKPLPQPGTLTLNNTRPGSNNQWTLSWNPDPNATAYELQESKDPNFTTVTTYDPGTDTSFQVQHDLTTKNVYHYRVRSFVETNPGPWSNAVTVVGGYRDDFTSSSSGWAIRRTTFIEEVRSWYENNDWLIMQVEDSWDWGIVSPLQPAPEPPYAIEYRSKPANLGNLVSHGAVFGGDWTGEPCPDYSSIEGVYQHDICFNHFYNINTIWYGPLKLLFERVDYLQWCPSCGGSPMKRGSYDYGTWFVVEEIPNVDANGWNTWRVTVRESGINIYANGVLFAHSDDNSWIDDPYFGIFASTDEYSNSTWRIDYFQITPLDS